MRTAIFPSLVAALFSASAVLAEALVAPVATTTAAYAPSVQQTVSATPSSEHLLELRQEVVTLNPSLATVPVDVITTQWLETLIGTSKTWAPVIYTQTFAAIPDQLPTAGAGSIGYGTLKKSKRDLVARETGIAVDYAQPVVLVLQHVVVTQYVLPVTEVLVIETVTLLPNMTLFNETVPGNASYNGTALFNGTGNGTWNSTASVLNRMAHLPVQT